MTTTAKTIVLDDYYAPKFRVPVLKVSRCAPETRHASISYVPLFRTTHPEPWRPGARRLSERRKRFTALSRA